MYKVPGLGQWLHDVVQDLTLAHNTSFHNVQWGHNFTFSYDSVPKEEDGKGVNRSLLPALPPCVSLSLLQQPSLHLSFIRIGSLAHSGSTTGKTEEDWCARLIDQAWLSFWKWYNAAWTVRVLMATNGVHHILLLYYTLCDWQAGGAADEWIPWECLGRRRSGAVQALPIVT